MIEADITEGPQMTCKGLRHGFGIIATNNGVQLNMLKKWIDHASIETTITYTEVVGEEEHEITARMWE